MEPLPRALILLGAVLIALGLAFHFGGSLPLGRLPGDFRVERPGFRLYVPIATCALVSIALSIVLWLASRFR